jgi:membrane fusion protein
MVAVLTVHEGDHVEAGDLLLKLDDTSVKSTLAIVDSSLAQLYARRSRLNAERANADSFTTRDVDLHELDGNYDQSLIDGEIQLFATRRSSIEGMRKQLEERKAQLNAEIEGDTIQLQSIDDADVLIKEELDAAEELYDRKIVTMQRVNSLKRQRVELEGNRGERLASRAQANGKINETNLQILQLDEDRRSEDAKDLADVQGKIAELEERKVATKDQLDHLEIRAPLTGKIFQLAIHTVGGVVNPGDALMLLAPDKRALTVEVKIAAHSVDQVELGQSVDIRFTAFDQKTTPEITGTVTSVSPDVITDSKTGATYYAVRAIPQTESLAQLNGKSLYPGMPAEVFIKTGERTALSYFAKPITDQMKHAFREE